MLPYKVEILQATSSSMLAHMTWGKQMLKATYISQTILYDQNISSRFDQNNAETKPVSSNSQRKLITKLNRLICK